MSIDRLQSQIRKLKNPSVVYFCLDKSYIPSAYLERCGGVIEAYCAYAKDLLNELKDIVPAVRFAFGTFALLGSDGLKALRELLALANELGYYILLDLPEITSPQEAVISADAAYGDAGWSFDGLALSCYIGSDAVKPFLQYMEQNDKDLFLLLRTANKSAQELQDLLTGSRLVYTAAADIAKRVGQPFVGRSGFSRVAGFGPATSVDSLQALRSKYPELFLLVDGYDYTGANAKNCSYAFDKLGHGAVVCAGQSIIAAWKEDAGADCLAAAVLAAERMKKNLTRYITIL